MIETLAIHGYRSLRDVVLPLGAITVVTGENGSGKSSLYRALGLLARIAEGRLIGALAAEGGLPAVVWAGPEMISARMRRGEAPVQGTGLRRRPVSLFAPPVLRRGALLVTRDLRVVQAYDGRESRALEEHLDARHSMITDLAAADAAPELDVLRSMLRGWRFHDSFRVDRKPRPAGRTSARGPRCSPTTAPTSLQRSRPSSRRRGRRSSARRSTRRSPAHRSPSPSPTECSPCS